MIRKQRNAPDSIGRCNNDRTAGRYAALQCALIVRHEFLNGLGCEFVCKVEPLDQRPFSNPQLVHQRLDFSGHQDDWRSAALCTLTNEVDRIAVEQFISAGMIEKNGHQISDFGTTTFR
jgi:hypothetical protein